MSDLQILDIMYDTFQLAVRLTMPFLLISMVVDCHFSGGNADQ